MSEANNNNKKKHQTHNDKRTNKMQDLVIPNDASKDQIITLLSTIFEREKIRTLTQLLGNNMRAEYVYVKKIEIMYNTYYS
jgi:hypothetical protein